MKTAMQELIEYLNSVEEDFKQKNWIELASVASMAIDKARKYLEKEKGQIKKAYKDCHDYLHIYGLDSEKYFNDEYKN